MRPVIGITCDYISADPSQFWLKEEYVSAIWVAGGWPLLIPPVEAPEFEDISKHLSGIIISGGDFDIEPCYYGEEPLPELGKINPRRSLFELELLRWIQKYDMPALGICGGIQAINVVFGGTLFQDIASQLPGALSHEQKRTSLSHDIRITPETCLHKLLQQTSLKVNSTHHQAIKELAPNLKVSAQAPDGIIEAIESKDHRFIVGIQWHPEAIYTQEPLWQKIFTGLVNAAQEFSLAQTQ